MRFSKILAASLVAPLAAAHGGIPGAPKIFGLGDANGVAALKSRNIYGAHAARAARSSQVSHLQARQGGDSNGRCGPNYGCATCAEGYCCSSGGWCGQGSDYCQAPDSLFEYGPAADANVLPSGGTTRNIARTKVGSVVYGGDGIWVCTKPGQIAITYDDGPYTYTTDLLNLFASYNFKATFFITGINLSKGSIDSSSQAWAAMISRMITDGHQVASHTWSHQDLSAITKEQRYEQMVRLEMALSNIIGKFPTYMRPPYSSCTAASGCIQDMADLGYHISYFDLDTDDYNNVTPEKAQIPKDRIYAALNPSNSATDEFLAIGHDIHYQTVYNMTAYMLDLMVKKGYTGVTMGECLNDPEANWYRSATGRVATTSSFAQPACASTRSSSSSATGSRTSTGATSTPTTVSTDSSCGAASGFTCLGFASGECCSQYNYCGSTEGHCGTGCQSAFGKCGLSLSSSSSVLSTSASSSKPATSSLISSTVASTASSTKASSTSSGSSTRVSSSSAPSSTPSGVTSLDASCGGTNGYTCIGFAEGECCSEYGWCGNTSGHCGTGCNPLFGKCTSSGTSSSGNAGSSTVKPSSSSTSKAASSSSSAAAASSTKPASTSTSKPASTSTSKPASTSSSKPASSSTKPASSSTKPASSSTKPASSSTKPASSSTKPTSSSTQPAASSTKVASSTAKSTPTGIVSPDASCGGTKGYHCIGFSQGECCSQYGWCGSTTAHCGTKCQPLYGKCT